MMVPRETTALRPTTGLNGMIRYNTTSLKFEVYEGRWQNMISAGGGAGDNLGNGQATTTILGITGTAALPSHSFLNGANRGMYALGTGGLAFSTGSAERLRISAAGNVGIWADPGANKVYVGGNGNSNIKIQSADNNQALFIAEKADATSQVGLYIEQADYTGFLIGSPWSTDISQGVVFSYWDGTTLNEYMRVGASGRIGMAASTPSAGTLLDINGTGINFSSFRVPRDTVGRRPTTGLNGMIRYNTSANMFEGYANNSWGPMIASNIQCATAAQSDGSTSDKTFCVNLTTGRSVYSNGGGNWTQDSTANQAAWLTFIHNAQGGQFQVTAYYENGAHYCIVTSLKTGRSVKFQSTVGNWAAYATGNSGNWPP
jgi:hypothetical protein